MLSTSSYSKTMIKENLSRYRMLPVLGLIALFITGILPVLMSYKRFGSVAIYAENVMSGTSFLITFIIMALAVAASGWVFGYLHDPVSSNAVHSMPVTRRSLFGSAVISRLVMIIIPIIMFALMTLMLRGATSAGVVSINMFDEMGERRLTAGEIYTLPHILALIFKSSVTALFYFAVACMAAVLSGRSGIHSMLSIWFFLRTARRENRLR